MIQRKSRGKRGWAISGRGVCLPATLMENSHGGESRKLGAQKKCVYAALCSVLADGMGNGRIAWDPRERSRDAQKQAYVIWEFDLLGLL